MRLAPLPVPAARHRPSRLSAASTASAARTLKYTALEGNSFKLELASCSLLVDPWLVGELSFGPWDAGADSWLAGPLYTGRKLDRRLLSLSHADGVDVLLLAQGLDDHAHKPTLTALAQRTPALPVVASPTAAAVARACGFTDVTALAPGQATVLACGLTVQATEGALVGPPWSQRENGFLLWEAAATGACVYYEPHCDFLAASVQAALRACGRPVDVAITPTARVTLAGYPLVLATAEAVAALVRLVQPGVVLPLRNDILEQSGLIAAAISEAGSPQAVREALAGSGLRARVLDAAAGVSLTVPL